VAADVEDGLEHNRQEPKKTGCQSSGWRNNGDTVQGVGGDPLRNECICQH